MRKKLSRGRDSNPHIHPLMQRRGGIAALSQPLHQTLLEGLDTSIFQFHHPGLAIPSRTRQGETRTLSLAAARL